MTITTPPENTTVCRGVDVTISCGYLSATALPVTWIINGTSFTQKEILNSPLYQLNNPIVPMIISLTVFSINGSTTFQCIVLSTPNTITSTCGTVTVTNGMHYANITPTSDEQLIITMYIKCQSILEINFNTKILVCNITNVIEIVLLVTQKP